MHKHIADQWVQALRSGDYEQGRDALRLGGQHCCLGVLCDLHRKEGGGEWIHSAPGNGPDGCLTYQTFDGDWDYSLLPDAVRRWAGLLDTSPALPGGRLVTQRNDDGWTFGQLADLIETTWEEL